MMDFDVLYEFEGTYADRSEVDLKFDGLSLVLTAEDQSSRQFEVKFSFSIVLDFEWSLEATTVDLPNFPTEMLICDEADDYLANRKSNDHPFLSKPIKRYRMHLVDLGILTVFATKVEIERVKKTMNGV